VSSFRLAAASPSDRLEVHVAIGDAPMRCVGSLGGMKGKTCRDDVTLAPGRYRWRVTFPADEFVTERTAARTAEGEVTVVAGETAVVDVPVVAK